MFLTIYISFILSLVTTNVFSQSNFIPLPPATCLVEGPDFFTSPQQPPTTTTLCTNYTTTTCCNSSYYSRIANHTDLFSSALIAFFDTLSSSCNEELSLLYCAPCFPDVGVWLKRLSTNSYKIVLCSALAERLYLSCSSSLVRSRNNTVSQVYSNSYFFLLDLFYGSNFIAEVIPSSDLACFDPHIRDCSADDIDYHYTSCVDNRRSLLYNWKFNISCSGGTRLPYSISLLECPIECSPGYYLPLGTTTCQPCPSGTYSLDGGYRVYTWEQWSMRFVQFETFCTDTLGVATSLCSGWSLNHTFIESASVGKHSTKSVLQTTVDIIHNGSVTFEAQVDCEYSYDRLTFSVDDDSYWIKNTVTSVRYTYPLSEGHHVLRWIYLKDSTVNYSYDRAMIYMIEVMGLADSSDYCDYCPPGTSSTEHAVDCTDCPANYFTNTSGSASCLPCVPGDYSFPGDPTCTPKKDCAVSDYQEHFTNCSAQHTRTKYFTWNQPKICKNSNTSVPLPDSTTGLDCAPCNPGQYRLADDCLTCPEGQYSLISTVGQCNPCPVGTYAPKQLSLVRWDTFPDGTIVSCEGQCATSGWRLMGDYTDSGVDHGGHVDSSFKIPVVIEARPFGRVTYTYTLSCVGWCFLEFRDGSKFIHSSWNEVESRMSNVTSGPFDFEPGPHNFTWNFSKFFGQRSADRALVYSVIIEGVSEGGAGECLQCPAGTVSVGGAPDCDVCAPGSYSLGGDQQCRPCQQNTYQNLPRQPECKPCGPGTSTQAGSVECSINNCTFTSDQDKYDFKDLAIMDGTMYGPIEEPRWPPQYVYLNPCVRQRAINATCLDSNGVTMDTYACLHDVLTSESYDLGHVMGYYPYLGPEKGVVLSFIEGSPGCGNPDKNQIDVPRSLNVTLICDPSAGVGRLERDGSIYAGTEYPNTCAFKLKWRSIYGCPLCTEGDHVAVKEACTNNQQTIRYVWSHYPPACHGGVQLPPPVTFNCTSTVTSCGVGTYLSPTDVCVPCEPGSYSLGNGLSLSTTNLSSFSFDCRGPPCSNWTSKNGALVSGSMGVSWIEATFNFKSTEATQNKISFEYAYNAQGSPFFFYVDSTAYLLSTPLVQKKPKTGFNLFSADVRLGSHKFSWVYHHGSLNFTHQRDNYVKLRNIHVTGIGEIPHECIRCLPPTVPNLNLGGCHECPGNMYPVSMNGSTFCEPCSLEPPSFRLEGQPTCVPLPPCTKADFIEVYPNLDNSRCGNPNRDPSLSTTFLPRFFPQTCTGTPPIGQIISNCIPCPNGTYWSKSENRCISCNANQYFDGKQCVELTPGHAAVRLSYFLSSTDVSSPDVDSHFLSEHGRWVLTGGYANSGIHLAETDSVLHLTVNTADYSFVPTVKFTAMLHESTLVMPATPTPTPTLTPLLKRGSSSSTTTAVSPLGSGFEVYIDGVIKDFPYTMVPSVPYVVEYPITAAKGEHVISWVYFQDQADEGLPVRYVTLSDVQVSGSSTGVTVSQQQCPAGTYYTQDLAKCRNCQAGTYSDAGASSCLKCPENSVSDTGSATCTKCGAGTTSLNNACKATCIFLDDDDAESPYEYNLTPLMGSIYSLQTNIDSTKYYYEINLCNKFFSEDCLPGKDYCTEFGYIFIEQNSQENEWSVSTLGTQLEFQPYYPKGADHTFDLVYTKGKNIPFGCSSVETRIRFVCDPNEGRGSPQPMQVTDQCKTSFSWSSIYACHKCLPSELVLEKGACIDGKRMVIYRYTNPCNGVLPSPTTEDCENINVGKTVAFITVSVVAIVIIIGLAVGFVFCQQKKNIETRYKLLKTEANMNDSDDDNASVLSTTTDKKTSEEVNLEQDHDDSDLPVSQE